MLAERGDEDDLEFAPLYQFYSPSGFRVDQSFDIPHRLSIPRLNGTRADSGQLGDLEKICNEIIPEDEVKLEGQIFDPYQYVRKDTGVSSIDFTINDDMRYRSRSMGSVNFGLDIPKLKLEEAQDVDRSFEFLDLTLPQGSSFNLEKLGSLRESFLDVYPTKDFHRYGDSQSPLSESSESISPAPSRASMRSPDMYHHHSKVQDYPHQRVDSGYSSPPSEAAVSPFPEHMGKTGLKTESIQLSRHGSSALNEMENVLFFESRFLTKYWRNDRKNIQCFPFCPEFGDYYTSRINNETHNRTGGTCTTPVVAKLQNNFDDRTRLIALGRITLYNPSVEQNFKFNHDINKNCERFISTEDYALLKKNSVVGSIVDKSVDGARSNMVIKNEKEITFRVSVWKLNMQLSKARRPTTLPSKVPMYIFEIMVLKPISNGYSIVARNISNKFTLASTRTLLREIIARNQSNTEGEDISHSSMSETYKEQPPSPTVYPSGHTQPVFGQRVRKFDEYEEEDYEKKRIKMTGGRSAVKSVKRESSEELDLIDSPEAAVPIPLYNIHSTITRQLHQTPNPTNAVAAQPVYIASPVFGQDIDYISVLNQNQGIRLGEAYVWGGFLGIFGAHHFYLGKPRRGVLYTMTLGLFVLGYIFDLLTMPYIVARSKISNATTQLKLPTFDELYVREAYIYLIPFGLFGAHQFYMGKYGKGFLYMFTLGLLGCGFIYDLIFLPLIVTTENNARKDKYIEKHGRRKLDQTQAFHKKYGPQSLCS